jgi:hypothetical protein
MSLGASLRAVAALAPPLSLWQHQAFMSPQRISTLCSISIMGIRRSGGGPLS